MAIVLSTAARNAKCDAVVDLLDAGTGTSGATIVFRTGGGTTLATILCSATAFGAASSGTATLAATTRDESADNSGTVAKAFFLNKSGTEVFNCDVATSSGDGATIVVPTTTVVAGQPFEISSLTFSA